MMKISPVFLCFMFLTALSVSHSADATTKVTEAVYPDPVPTMQGSPGSNGWRIEGAQRKHYNLHVSSTVRNGGFAIDDRLLIKNRKGRVFLDVRNADPVFFAQLPQGHYIVIATSGLQQKIKKFTISKRRGADVNLVW